MPLAGDNSLLREPRQSALGDRIGLTVDACSRINDASSGQQTRNRILSRRGENLHSRPGLNTPFGDRLALVLARITVQNGNSS